nr:hypothetical protein [Tanacetum cinerariifolium]
IEIRGVIDWFKECLEKHMSGEGGNLAAVQWPTKTVTRRAGRMKKKIKTEVSTGEGWQPLLDWRDFAQRNDIELPENIDKFFPPLAKMS